MNQCKYKLLAPTDHIPAPEKWCQIMWGYCQFLENGYEDGHICPLAANYKDYDKYWLSTNMDKDGKVKVDNIYDNDTSTTNEDGINILDITI